MTLYLNLRCKCGIGGPGTNYYKGQYALFGDISRHWEIQKDQTLEVESVCPTCQKKGESKP